MKLVNINDMKILEELASQKYKIPKLILMEHAGKALADKCLEVLSDKTKSVVIISGVGNNGGDGFVAARHFINNKIPTIIYSFIDFDFKGLSKENFDILNKMNATIKDLNDLNSLEDDLSKCEVIIDCIFGTGLVGKVNGVYKQIIEIVNNKRARVISADIPSGVEANTGVVNGICMKADYTLTFGYGKLGLYQNQGPIYSGDVEVVNISLPKSQLEKGYDFTYELLDKNYISPMLPNRAYNSHKNTFGHVLTIGGSKGMSGAIGLSSLAALRSGAGLVTKAMPKLISNESKKSYEIMNLLLEEENEYITNKNLNVLIKYCKKSTSIAIGPGMGQNVETKGLLYNLLLEVDTPTVLDADGLNLVSEILKKEPRFLEKINAPLVLTPHLKEMSRLTNMEIDKIEENRIEIAKKYAHTWNVILVLKGANTIIATPNKRIFINEKGNPGMATAGSGDVLTGMIAGFIGQKKTILEATLLAVYLHGLSGNLAKLDLGEYSIAAGDLIEYLPQSIKKAAIT